MRGLSRTVENQQRRLTGGAALLCLAALVAACGSVDPTPAGSAAASSSSLPAASSSSGPATASGSAAEQLDAALTALEPGYTFDTTISVGDKIAAGVQGRRFGNASELVILSGGASVTYRILPSGSWLKEEGKAWVKADTSAQPTDPLAPLLAAQRVEAMPDATGGTQFKATYPAGAFGLSGKDPVSVTVTLGSDGMVTAKYTTTVNGNQSVSQTVLKPAPSQDPIIAPVPGPSPSPQ
jgi:hypothetical protein